MKLDVQIIYFLKEKEKKSFSSNTFSFIFLLSRLTLFVYQILLYFWPDSQLGNFQPQVNEILKCYKESNLVQCQ